MMKESRLGAVDHINLEAGPEHADALRWFYGEVAGLEEQEPAGPAPAELVFKSALVELRIRLTEDPQLVTLGNRLTVAVPSLEASIELLKDQSVEFERLSGLSFTDRRLGLLDPAGNRITLKQHWPGSPI